LQRRKMVEHRHDDAYTMSSLPCPFVPWNRRAMDAISQHPRHPLNPINRALPQLNSAHHLTLLPSLLLLDPLASPIVARVTGIASSKPPVPGGCSRRFEPPQAPPPVPVASAPSPTLPRTSPPTAGALVRPPTP
jgi:hypothetical protein